MISPKDRTTIRELARKWMELASLPVMQERKRLWKAVHDLKAERPVVLFEVDSIVGYVSPEELVCEDPMLRGVERQMRMTLRQAEEVGDDQVVEPYFRIPWRIRYSDYGVPVEIHAAQHQEETDLAYSFSFPIATPEDIGKLKKRTIAVDRRKSLEIQQTLEDVMGDILPIRLGNIDSFAHEFELDENTSSGFGGVFFFGLTWQVYRFLGNDRLLLWPYDEPDALHRLMKYMLDDRIALFEYLQQQGVLDANTDTQMAGPRAYGYVSDLPEVDGRPSYGLKDLWGWAESQEAAPISPAMYKEFVLPYLAELSSKFRLVYYGCCERVDDRLEMILEAIPNLRSVSVSGWTDLGKAAEMLGGDYVYSRKPTPAHISGPNADWEQLEKDMKDTYAVARDSNVEILFRDVYDVPGDRSRLRKWVEMTKSVFQM